MATLKKHGQVLLTLDCCDCRKAYMSDGHILKNYGYGWKLYRKVKQGINPVDVANKSLEKRKLAEVNYPNGFKFVHAMADVSLKHRLKVYHVITQLGYDLDGAWSEINEFENIMSLDEVKELVEFYKLYEIDCKLAANKHQTKHQD